MCTCHTAVGRRSCCGGRQSWESRGPSSWPWALAWSSWASRAQSRPPSRCAGAPCHPLPMFQRQAGWARGCAWHRPARAICCCNTMLSELHMYCSMGLSVLECVVTLVHSVQQDTPCCSCKETAYLNCYRNHLNWLVILQTLHAEIPCFVGKRASSSICMSSELV